MSGEDTTDTIAEQESEGRTGGGARAAPVVADSMQPVVAYSVGAVVNAEAVPEKKIDSSTQSRKWVHGFCDICYVDKESSNRCFPYCFPYSTPCSCVRIILLFYFKSNFYLYIFVSLSPQIMLGMMVTKYSKEQPICCEMDSQGIMCCLGSSLAAYFTADLFCVIHAMFFRAGLVE